MRLMSTPGAAIPQFGAVSPVATRTRRTANGVGPMASGTGSRMGSALQGSASRQNRAGADARRVSFIVVLLAVVFEKYLPALVLGGFLSATHSRSSLSCQ